MAIDIEFFLIKSSESNRKNKRSMSRNRERERKNSTIQTNIIRWRKWNFQFTYCSTTFLFKKFLMMDRSFSLPQLHPRYWNNIALNANYLQFETDDLSQSNYIANCKRQNEYKVGIFKHITNNVQVLIGQIPFNVFYDILSTAAAIPPTSQLFFRYVKCNVPFSCFKFKQKRRKIKKNVNCKSFTLSKVLIWNWKKM